MRVDPLAHPEYANEDDQEPEQYEEPTAHDECGKWIPGLRGPAVGAIGTHELVAPNSTAAV
jgi:hypothetical protein